MNFDLFSQPDIQIHSGEKDKDGNEFYQKNKKKFSNQLIKVLEILLTGEILTQLSAIEKYKIFSLSSRCSELKRAGMPPQKHIENGMQHYYFLPSQIQEYKNRL